MSNETKIEITEKQWHAVMELVRAFQPTLATLTEIETQQVSALCPHCQKVFFKTRPDQVYCCPLHQRNAWFARRRQDLKEQRALEKQRKMEAFEQQSKEQAALPQQGEEVQCVTVGCENRFVLQIGVAFGDRCDSCREQLLGTKQK